MSEYRRVVQIIPAVGWRALFADETDESGEDHIFYERVAFWALIDCWQVDDLNDVDGPPDFNRTVGITDVSNWDIDDPLHSDAFLGYVHESDKVGKGRRLRARIFAQERAREDQAKRAEPSAQPRDVL